MIHIDNIIIGAGPTGLSAAYQLDSLGRSYTIFEKSNSVGGLCGTFGDTTVFDKTSHIFFSNDPEILDLVRASELNIYRRKAVVNVDNNLIPFPVQNHIGSFPNEIKIEILKDLYNLKSKESKNYKDLLLNTYGKTLFSKVLKSYNEKVWNYNLSKMGTYWFGGRICMLTIEQILNSLTGQTNWGPNASFYYPVGKSFDQIFAPLLEQVPSYNISLNSVVTHIDPVNKVVVTNNKYEFTYDNLISTIPLISLCKLLKMKCDFPYTSVLNTAISVKLDSPVDHKFHWMYYSNPNFPYYRVFNLSSVNTSIPNTELRFLCETSFRGNEILHQNNEGLIGQILADFGIVQPFTIKKVNSYYVEYAYPIPVLGLEEKVKKILNLLDSKNIYSRGRFGAWSYKYGNTDHAIRYGLDIANRIVSNSKETLI